MTDGSRERRGMGSRFRGNDDKERRRVFGPAALLFWSMERRGVTLTPPPLDTGPVSGYGAGFSPV